MPALISRSELVWNMHLDTRLKSGTEHSMLNDISCVINAHREGNVLFPTIVSVKRAVEYAISCGLKVDIHVVMDNSDDTTKEIVLKEAEDTAQPMLAHDVDYRDLAFSRNFAATQSTGKYTAFVDGDDLWSRTWLVDSFVMAERCNEPMVLHPEYNIFFGDETSHVFNHVDMDDQDFEIESLYRMNYWTALSFAKTSIYLNYSYKKNTILDGFGYEDWTWNYETISDGIKHKIVPGTVHFIRKGRAEESLLARTNKVNAIPRIFKIYHSAETEQDMPEQINSALPEGTIENTIPNSDTAVNDPIADSHTISDESDTPSVKNKNVFPDASDSEPRVVNQ